MTTRFSIVAALLLASTALGENSGFNVFSQKKASPGAATKASAALFNVQPEIHFEFEDLKDVRDSGKARVHVTVTGTESVAGHIGRALEFSGEDSKITIDTDLSKIITSGYTVACWVRPHSQNGYGVLFNSNGNHGVSLRLQGTCIDLNTGNTWHLIMSDSDVMKLEQWTHVAATSDGSVAKLYVDGKLIGEKEVTERIEFGTTAVMGQVTETLVDEASGGKTDKADQFLNGSIDDFRVYDTALTAEQIAALAK